MYSERRQNEKKKLIKHSAKKKKDVLPTTE